MNATVDDECFGHGNIPVMIDLKFPNQVLKKHFEKHPSPLSETFVEW